LAAVGCDQVDRLFARLVDNVGFVQATVGRRAAVDDKRALGAILNEAVLAWHRWVMPLKSDLIILLNCHHIFCKW